VLSSWGGIGLVAMAAGATCAVMVAAAVAAADAECKGRTLVW
jgi:hypothetical protein